MKPAQLPAFWASALINGDRTGLTTLDEIELDNYLVENPEHNNPVDVSEDSEIGVFSFSGRPMLCELLTYSFLEI